MEKNILWAFLAGLYAGRFTNMFSNLIITGAAMYYIDPDIYSYSTLSQVKETVFRILSK
jgi:hypothetical protein